MKVLKVSKYTAFFVETDDSDFGGDYRRGESGGWEQRMGESWESCDSREDELEAAFQEFMRSNISYTPKTSYNPVKADKSDT